MKLRQVPGEFSIGRFDPDIALPAVASKNFCSISRTPGEVTIVCETDYMPRGCDKREDGWACLEVEGILDSSISGLITKISTALAGAEISLFAVSTFDTDYVLVKAKTLAKARDVLRRAGVSLR